MLLLQQQNTQQHQQQQREQKHQKTNKNKKTIGSSIKNINNECIITTTTIARTVNKRIKLNKNCNKRNNNSNNKIIKVKTFFNWMPAAIVNVQQQQRLEVEAEQGKKQAKRKEPKQHHHHQNHYRNHNYHQYHHYQQQQQQEQPKSITKSNINLCTQIRATEKEVQQQQHQHQQQQQQQHKQQHQHQQQHNYHKYQEQHDNQHHYQHRQNGAKNTMINSANTYSTIPTTSPTRTSPTTSARTIINPIERDSEISRASTITKATRRVAKTTRLVIIIMTLVFGIISNQQQQQQQKKLSWYNGIYVAAATTTTEVESTQQIPAATYFYNNSNIEYHNIVSSSREKKLQKDVVSIKQPQSQPQTETTNYTFRSLAFIDDGRLNVVASSTSLAVAKFEQQSLEALPIFDFGMPRNITGRTGHSEALIKCRVDKLNDKSVSWIRKRDLHILTVATATYTSDKRFEVTESKDSREWTLHVKAPQTRDSGIYECQVNTEPKMSMAFQLNIIEISPDAKAIISGPPDLHFKVGSAIILNCVVQQPSSVKDIGPIYWYRGEHMITPFEADDAENTNDDDNDDDGAKANALPAKPSVVVGAEHNDLMTNDILVHQQKDFAARIAMESQLGDTLKSRLRISNAQTMDTGNYTCQPTTANSASVMVHVINDENPAAMQKSAAVALFRIALSSSLEGAFLIEVLQLLVLRQLLLPLLVLL